MRSSRRLAAASVVLGLFAAGPSCALQPLAPCAGGCGGAVDTGPYHLSASVSIRRDEHGIVHLYGKTDEDALYAQGYMQANDRLFQMELQKRNAQGRLAEVEGSDHVSDDEIVRVIGIPSLGHDNAVAMQSSDPRTYGLTRAWVSGVNARIAEVIAGKAPLPTGFADTGFMPEAWTVDDAFAVAKLIVFGNGNQLEFDGLATLLHKLNPKAYGEVPFFQPLANAFILTTAGREASVAPPHASSPIGAPLAFPSAPAPAVPPGMGARIAAFLKTMRHFHPGASNNFAVDGSHTASGRSMIAGDPHQPLRSPSLMWMSHINSADQGGTLDAEGWSFVGTPGVSLGHNRNIAWTATTNYPDVTDLWDVAYDGTNVTVGGKTVAVDAQTETIAIQGGTMSTITIEKVPGYGVLLPDDIFPIPLAGSGRRVLFNWTGFRVTNEARAFVDIADAKSMDDFDAAVDRFELGSFNFVGASRDDISYRSSPLVPDRGDPKTHAPAYEMMSGDDASSLWTGAFLTGERLPHTRAITTGIIVTANNDPFGFTETGTLASAPFYFGAYYDAGLRAERMADDLMTTYATHPLGEDDLIATQTDVHSLLADELVGDLVAAHGNIATSPTLAQYKNRPDLDALVAMLSSWDKRMTRDQAAPVAFEFFMYLLVRDVLQKELDPFFDPILGQEPLYLIKFAVLLIRDQSPVVQGGNDLALLKALDEASQLLQARYGSASGGYTWKDYHQTSFGSDSDPVFDGGQISTDGGEGTVDVSSGAFFDANDMPAMNHISDEGSIYRMVAMFDDAGLPHAKFNPSRAATPASRTIRTTTISRATGRTRVTKTCTSQTPTSKRTPRPPITRR